VAPDLVRRAVAAAAVLLAACGGDDDEPATTTTAVAAPATTVAPATSTSPTTAAPTGTTATTCPGPAGDPPVAAVDLDGDGVEEVWRDAGSGAATDIVELRVVVGCDEVTVTNGCFPAQFAVGGSVLLLQGIRCEGGRVVHLGAASEDGETYATLDITYELRGTELVAVDEESGELSASDPALVDYSRFDC
jgi:hypothetical protein